MAHQPNRVGLTLSQGLGTELLEVLDIDTCHIDHRCLSWRVIVQYMLPASGCLRSLLGHHRLT